MMRRINLSLSFIGWLIMASFAPMAVAKDALRFSGEGELYDLGAEYRSGQMTVYLADKQTNAPHPGLKVEFVPNDDGDEIKFSDQGAGVYQAAWDRGADLDGQISVNYEMEGEDTLVIEKPGREGHDHSAGDGNAPSSEKGGHDEGHEDNHATQDGGHDAHHDDERHADSHGGWPFHGHQNWLLLAISGVVFLGGWFGGSMHARRSVAITLLAGSGLFMNGPDALAGAGHAHAEVGVSSAGEGTTIRLTKKSQFLIGLRTQMVEQQQVVGVLRTFGHMVAKPQLDARIRAPRAGVLEGISENVWGKTVQRNETVAKVDAVGLVNIRTPIAGTVIAATGVSGARIEAGDEIMRIVNTELLWVDAEVFQKDLARVRQASKAFVTLESTTGLIQREARLVGAQTVVDERTMTGKVLLEIDNKDNQFALGNTVQVLFQIDPEARAGMVLPFTSVVNRGAETIVYVKTGPETFEPRSVRSQPGAEPGTVTVTAGLDNGDRVVTAGNYQLLVGAK